MPSKHLNIAIVCSSNQNRSMEAHSFLSKKGFMVKSFGVGTAVKLPGPSSDKPNIYDFSTTYDEMYKDLFSRDPHLYTQNGILHMLDRNRRIKPKPEQFQKCYEHFDLVITCEERIFDEVVLELLRREQTEYRALPCHVINIDISDNQEDATIGAFMICDLCSMMEASEDLDCDIENILQAFETKSRRSVLHDILFA
ncbi:RNA polymerase II subunit A C-terminal domain phosphatase SSU72-like [Convolutriloba macropyga]|uniref:RNA polymerase II subunit A C-terminal domain phosphatase SSU72-like n=1 Tax=Convolutriloba macropyga TaxID=536237 RepID=UPI003F524815